ncbi:pre-toxin TG domain-containing protein [Listeria newyorkensis]|uniref:LXG domain-containing protein n=1 Tax=Listeria newyorkensis TaxID=1497681 RepID=A0A841YVJ8_9LIST|nr:pre-toxin TG domain-containing protein [Listeria newyorkensis]MBC1457119.1 hypothetical protein [Listeria newyorkensis]
MSLNVFVGEVEAQTESMVAFYREAIAAMEDVMRVVDEFAFDQELQGKTYESAKQYFVATYRPLAQGMICLCEELIRQNEVIPRDFKAEVATVDVIEDQVRNQIRQLDGQIQDIEKLSNNVVGMALITPIFVDMKLKLEEKLEALYRFDAETATSFDRAMDLAANVARGLAEIGKDKGFQAGTGTFSTMGMNMTWSSTLQKQWATREKAIAQGLKDAETARMIKLAEDGPLPVVPEGNLAGFVTKDGKLDGKATYDNAKWQQAHYLAGMENAIFLIDMVTPIFDVYRLKTGLNPITKEKLTEFEKNAAAGFTVLNFVPFGKLGKAAKAIKASTRADEFKFVFENVSDVGKLGNTSSKVIKNRYPNDIQTGKTYTFTIENGSVRGLNGMENVDFIIDMDGNLKLGSGHSFLANGEAVKAAGKLKINGTTGQIRKITNWSGHYTPSPMQAKHFPTLLENTGLNVNNSWLELYNINLTNSGYVNLGEVNLQSSTKLKME